MRSVTINCNISIGVENSFYPEIKPDNESNAFLKQLFNDNDFLVKMASYFYDQEYIKNVSITLLDMVENTCNILVKFDSDYTSRVIEKIMKRNFYHYLRSGGLAKYKNGELFIRLSDFKFNDVLYGHLDRIYTERNCTVCDHNAYIYYYDNNNDLTNSSCINYDSSKENIDTNDREVVKYIITDKDHHVLVTQFV